MNSDSSGGELKKYLVTKNEMIAPGVYVLRYKRDFSFIPGQVVAIALNTLEPPRMYSIASGMQDDEIWILFNIRPGGELTPRLADLKPGDTIFASPPMGNFFGTAKPSTWIAAGTGIAPFVSMWRSGLKQDKIIIHGGRFMHSFYFQNEFISLPADEYIRCCSGEPSQDVYYGRLTHWIAQEKSLPADRKYYLCGSAEMVVDTRDLLIEKGIPFSNVLAEIYF